MALRQFVNVPAGGGHVQQGAATGFSAKDDIFGHGEDGHEHKVLMHHADPVANRRAWPAHPHRLTAHQHLTGILLIQAVENVHQRGLPGAILTKQRQHLAVLERQAHLFVGKHAWKALGNAACLKHDRSVAAHTYSFS